MKKFLCGVLSIIFCGITLLCSSTSVVALGLDNYFRIANDSAVLYSSETLSADSELFLLPKGYFVKIISQTEHKIYCEYADSTNTYSKILGHVDVKNLKSSEGIFPIYPKIILSSLTSSPIYARPNTNSKVVLSVFAGQNLAFYGYSTNKEFIFVLIGNDFGYIPISNVDSPVVPNHPLPLPSPIPTPTPPSIPTEVPPVDGTLPQAMQILLVAFIFVPLILLSVLIFKK